MITPIEQRDKEHLMRAYLESRQNGVDPQKAILALIPLTDRPAAQVRVWARQDNWEGAFRALSFDAAASADQRQLTQQLADLQRRRNQMRDLELSLGESAELSCDPEKSRAYIDAGRAVDELDTRIERLTAQAATRYGDKVAVPVKRKRYDVLVEELKAQYAGHGVHYMILCEQVAAAKVYLENVQESGSAIASDDWQKMNKVVFDGIRTLQQYTESVKTEIVIREREQAAMVHALELLELFLRPRAPTLWQEALNHVVPQLEAPRTPSSVIDHEREPEPATATA